MMNDFWDVVKNRRSVYGLGDEKIVTEDRIEMIVREAIKNTPSPYNSQSTRIVLLFDSQSKKFWKYTLDALRAITNDEQYAASEKKINGAFAGGYGTVLFFEDQDVVESFIKEFPLFAERFPVWSQHTNAMHQFVVWSGLEAEGLGATLQHYNPLVDDAVRNEWNLSKAWKLVAQMPFGKPMVVSAAKEFSDVDARLKVFR